MHSLLNSLRKRVYTARLSSAGTSRIWREPYWQQADGMRSIACRHCPKFSAATVTCTVPFGSPLRKCVTAAQEAHLHSLAGKDLLEIGFGKHSIPRRLVTSAGGTWTGIDPLGQPDTVARIGGACRGHVGAIPFADASFDIVVGIQTLEHWSDPLPDDSEAPGYARGLAEVHRVLKPGGTIYFDAPIHLHGHEMFISGDVDTIAAQFGHSLWSDVILEAWRRDHSPLPRYPTPDADLATWPVKFARSAPERIAAIRESGSVWLLVVTATKH